MAVQRYAHHGCLDGLVCPQLKHVFIFFLAGHIVIMNGLIFSIPRSRLILSSVTQEERVALEALLARASYVTTSLRTHLLLAPLRHQAVQLLLRHGVLLLLLVDVPALFCLERCMIFLQCYGLLRRQAHLKRFLTSRVPHRCVQR